MRRAPTAPRVEDDGQAAGGAGWRSAGWHCAAISLNLSMPSAPPFIDRRDDPLRRWGTRRRADEHDAARSTGAGPELVDGPRRRLPWSVTVASALSSWREVSGTGPGSAGAPGAVVVVVGRCGRRGGRLLRGAGALAQRRGRRSCRRRARWSWSSRRRSWWWSSRRRRRRSWCRGAAGLVGLDHLGPARSCSTGRKRSSAVWPTSSSARSLVLHARQLDDDGVALAGDLGLGHAEGVDPVADDLDGLVEGVAASASCGGLEHHRHARPGGRGRARGCCRRQVAARPPKATRTMKIRGNQICVALRSGGIGGRGHVTAGRLRIVVRPTSARRVPVGHGLRGGRCVGACVDCLDAAQYRLAGHPQLDARGHLERTDPSVTELGDACRRCPAVRPPRHRLERRPPAAGGLVPAAAGAG